MLLGLVLLAGMVALIMFVSNGRQRSRPHYGGDTGSGDSSWMFSGSGSDGSSDCGSSDGGCDGGGGGDGGGGD